MDGNASLACDYLLSGLPDRSIARLLSAAVPRSRDRQIVRVVTEAGYSGFDRWDDPSLCRLIGWPLPQLLGLTRLVARSPQRQGVRGYGNLQGVLLIHIYII